MRNLWKSMLSASMLGAVTLLYSCGGSSSSDAPAPSRDELLTSEVQDFFNAAGRANRTAASTADLNLNANNFNLTTPNFLPQASSSLLSGADFTGENISDNWFSRVNHVGAFGSTDWTSGWANFDPQNANYPATNRDLGNGNTTTGFAITANRTLSADSVYRLTGFVFVRSGATLTIPAGTVIRGDRATLGTIIVERGGRIVAEGTATNPVVFTSNAAVGSRTYGDWGGIVVLGRAPINPTNNPAIEGVPNAFYGGTDAADNSGTLKYCRLEFSGVAITSGNEINGLTMGGVGSGTTIEYVQVSYCGDDSFEWFGGTVNCRYLIALRTWDDDFDTDFGYSGRVQFGVALRDPQIADTSTSNAFESDNDATGSSNAPITSAIFSNISVFGPRHPGFTGTPNTRYGAALHLRRNTRLRIHNSVFTGFSQGLFVQGAATFNNMRGGQLLMRNCVLANHSETFRGRD